MTVTIDPPDWAKIREGARQIWIRPPYPQFALQTGAKWCMAILDPSIPTKRSTFLLLDSTGKILRRSREGLHIPDIEVAYYLDTALEAGLEPPGEKKPCS
jgi:hypothetical protein